MPDEFSEKPRILVLACENDAYPGARHGRDAGHQYSAFTRVIPVRCLGSVNTIWITDALNSGYDGVMLMGCQKGDDYQCHFVKGSELAHYAHEQDRRHAEAAQSRAGARRDLRGRHHRHQARAAS
jgi:quinone-modifying oxidoreductase, subunit QmoB